MTEIFKNMTIVNFFQFMSISKFATDLITVIFRVGIWYIRRPLVFFIAR